MIMMQKVPGFWLTLTGGKDTGQGYMIPISPIDKFCISVQQNCNEIYIYRQIILHPLIKLIKAEALQNTYSILAGGYCAMPPLLTSFSLLSE